MIAEARVLTRAGALLPVPGTGAWTVASAGDAVSGFAILAHLVGGRADLVRGDLPHADLDRLRGLALLDPDDLADALDAKAGR